MILKDSICTMTLKCSQGHINIVKTSQFVSFVGLAFSSLYEITLFSKLDDIYCNTTFILLSLLITS